MRFTTPQAFFWSLTLVPIILLGLPRRGSSRNREITSLIIRILICLAIILALTGLELKDLGKSNSLAVVFLLDVSDSMPQTAIQTGLGIIRTSLQGKPPDDKAALIVFGSDALVEKAMSTDPFLNELRSIPLTNQSNLASAVNLGMATFPPGSARRMVIISDGVFTSGNSLETLQAAAASGVEIVVVPLTSPAGPEVLVQDVSAPSRLHQGDQFDLQIKLNSNQSGYTAVRVFADNNLIYEGSQEVHEGLQTLNLPLTAEQPGFTRYKVSIEPASDQYYQNNQLSTYTQIFGPPRLLIVSPVAGEPLNSRGEIRPDETSPLRSVLEQAGFEVNQVIPELLPLDLASLAGFSSVVLVDVPATRLSSNQMRNLQAYVKDLGGGLVAVGGPTSYGAGGYFKTPLEEVLPVNMQIKDEQRRPSLAIVYIIDHSGSMAESSGGPTKLELAKEAVIHSVELLNPSDKVGVIAFDDAASWVFPITELGDGIEVKNRTASIGIGGGTDILAGIQAMASVFPDVEAGTRHVILLTDGGADPTGIPELVQKMYADNGITLSAIGVGLDAAPYLADLANLGGGRYHFAKDPGSIPTIYAEETSLATRSYIIEEAFTPEIIIPSTILEGIGGVPELLGYIGTSAKDTAQTILVSDKGDPVLAVWRYGLGKAVSFTSDASGRWAKAWLKWDGYSEFWTQIVRSSISSEIPDSLDIEADFRDEATYLYIDAGKNPLREETGNYYLNNYSLELNVIDPEGNVEVLVASQVSPGKYETQFTPAQEGVYLIRASGSPPSPDYPPVAATTGWAMDYSAEYSQINPEPENFLRLANQAGGHLANQEPGRLFEHTLQNTGIYIPVWHWLLLAAAILLPFDIAVRRLVINKSDLLRAGQKLQRFIAERREKSEQTSEPSQRMQELLNLKQKTAQPTNSLNKKFDPGIGPEIKTKSLNQTPPMSQAGPSPLPDSEMEATNRQDEASILPESSVSKLLKKKRSSRESSSRKSS